MVALLTRLNLSPPGVKRLNDNWSLLKTNNNNSKYEDFLAQLANKIMQEEKEQKNSFENMWLKISSSEIGKYILSRHPQIQFLDFSEYCDLILITHIQAVGIEKKYWTGKSRAGSSQFTKIDAKNRTISEVLERTFISEFQLSLDKIWGSAIAPTEVFAKLYAAEECLERWITYQACLNKNGFKLIKTTLSDFYSFDFIQAIYFEWEKYNGKINIFSAENPYKLNVILVKVEVTIDGKCWVFYSNGIGNTPFQAIRKALLESIQFIPGKNEKLWLEELEKQSTDRLKEWQYCELNFDDKIKKDLRSGWTVWNDKQSYLKHILEIIKIVNGDIFIRSSSECQGIYFGYVHLSNEQNWDDYKGIPIA